LRSRIRSWGAPRIHGELLKLGSMFRSGPLPAQPRHPKPPSQTWRTLPPEHVADLAPSILRRTDGTFRVLYVSWSFCNIAVSRAFNEHMWLARARAELCKGHVGDQRFSDAATLFAIEHSRSGA